MTEDMRSKVWGALDAASYIMPTIIMLALCVFVKTSMDDVAAAQKETLEIVKDVQAATLQAIELQRHERERMEGRLIGIEAQIFMMQHDESDCKGNRKRKLQH